LVSAWIGQQAASGDVYDFDGKQVQLKFGGSNSRSLSGAEVFQSDAVAFSFDRTRPLIVSAYFQGTQVNLETTYPDAGIDPALVGCFKGAGADDSSTTDATGYTVVPTALCYGVRRIDSTGTRLVARDFLWFIVRDRTTNAQVFDGYWSGVGDITADVIDPETGGTVSRSWFGAGGLISIDDIPLLSTLTVQTVAIRLGQCSDRVNDLMRTYDCKQGTVQVFRGLYNPDTRVMVSPAYPRFVGFIDEAPIKTPKENEQGDVTLTCTAHTSELTRANAEMRSDASQKLRSATDNFFQDAAVVGSWQHFWGRAQGEVQAAEFSRPERQKRYGS
jgi:hypothetical protein